MSHEGDLDLTACEQEPIHVPGSIQPHGVLLALREPALTVAQASANAVETFGRPLDAVLGARLDEVLGREQGASLRALLDNPSLEQSPLYLQTVTLPGGDGPRHYHAVAHRHDGALILELEATPAQDQVSFRDLYPLMRSFITSVQAATTVEELCRLAAVEVRAMTGFDRVLVYRFAADWNGQVVAETRDEAFEPYLGLWFPASDVPRQARDLYRLTRLRLIPDARYVPVPIVPALSPDTGRPLDLTFAVLRSVSPVHVEYLRNMGVTASMSIAVVREGNLWGLISCHHRTPRVVPFDVRTACDLVGQFLSQQLAAQERHEEYDRRFRLKRTQASLLKAMAAEPNFIEGLVHNPAPLLELAAADGAAVLFDDNCLLVGCTPTESEVRQLADRVAESGDEVFHTNSLADRFPEAAAYSEMACGALAIQLSKLYRSYLIWFRREVVQTVTWGGDPRKQAMPSAVGPHLHPRKSFERWQETVRGRALPFDPAEVAAVADLRNDIVGIVLRKAEEMAELAGELRRSNQELESFSYSVSHDLRAPFRHIFGYAELLRDREAGRLDETSVRYLDTILDSARYAGTLVDHLLAFSQMSRGALDLRTLDLGELVSEVRRELELESSGRIVMWKVGPLPRVRADVEMMRLVVRNLLSNAFKYTRLRAEAVIEIGGEVAGREVIVSVKDNGVGFDMRYADKLFGVFQRLHRVEEFEGTGIGLANVRRIVARHGGRTWAEGKEGHGATFYFSLPRPEEG